MGTWYEIRAFFPMPEPLSLFARLADELGTSGIELRGTPSTYGKVDTETDWHAHAAERWALDAESDLPLTSFEFVVSDVPRPRSSEEEGEGPAIERVNILGFVVGQAGRVDRESFAALKFNIKGWEYFRDPHTRVNLAVRFARIVGSVGLDFFYIGGPGMWEGLRRPHWPLDEAQFLFSGRLERLYDWTYLGPDWWKKYKHSAVMRTAVRSKEAVGDGVLLECDNSPQLDFWKSHLTRSQGRRP